MSRLVHNRQCNSPPTDPIADTDRRDGGPDARDEADALVSQSASLFLCVHVGEADARVCCSDEHFGRSEGARSALLVERLGRGVVTERRQDVLVFCRVGRHGGIGCFEDVRGWVGGGRLDVG